MIRGKAQGLSHLNYGEPQLGKIEPSQQTEVLPQQQVERLPSARSFPRLLTRCQFIRVRIKPNPALTTEFCCSVIDGMLFLGGDQIILNILQRFQRFPRALKGLFSIILCRIQITSYSTAHLNSEIFGPTQTLFMRSYFKNNRNKSEN